jgi:homoserine O-acetyltransferase
MTAAHLILMMAIFTPEYRARKTSRAQFDEFFKGAGSPESTTDSDGDDWDAQLDAILAMDVAHGEQLSTAAARVHAHFLIVASDQDHTVNPAPALEFAQLLHAKTLVLHGDCGHIAPFCEVDKVRPVIESFLAKG